MIVKMVLGSRRGYPQGAFLQNYINFVSYFHIFPADDPVQRIFESLFGTRSLRSIQISICRQRRYKKTSPILF